MKKFKYPFVSKKNFKRRYNFCQICKIEDYNLLDVHRIQWGGSYSVDNCVVLCTICHRKVHSGIIIIKGWVHSTSGNLLLYIDEKGQEKFS